MRASEVAELLVQSKRPLIHIGQGVRHGLAECERLRTHHFLPFVTARCANDFIDSADPLHIGRPGTFAQRGANFAVQLCDLYIAIGTRLSLTQTGYNSKDYARNAKIVQVDISQEELDKGTLREPIKICQDAKTFLTKLLIALPPSYRAPPEWIARCQMLRDKYPVCLPEYEDQKDSVNSYYFIDLLSDMASPEDTIVTDMGFAFQNTHQAWKVKKGQRLMTNCGLAPMGWGLPAAVGAAFATGRRVLCITGDGGLMMNVQELATVCHHRLPIKIFLLENGGYLTIKQTQELGFDGRLMGVNEDTGLSFPDFVRLAGAFGIPYAGTKRHQFLRGHIERAFETRGPYLLELRMARDQPQAPRAVNRRNADGSMNPTKLEDSHPFLPPEEVAEMMNPDGFVDIVLKTNWRWT